MNVGDLVTLSAAGKKTDKVIAQHKQYFRGPESSYYGLCSEDKKRFNEYWENDKVVGLITNIWRNPIKRYCWQSQEYIQDGDREKVIYYVAWQANPRPMRTDQHPRSHLKFVKRGKKK
ncbi:MAG: hypothetical protein CL398_03280 [Acidiferrobacteraceae bacterium]|nr:hypothetical protein [Acidiferrobacteraceae bacterium]